MQWSSGYTRRKQRLTSRRLFTKSMLIFTRCSLRQTLPSGHTALRSRCVALRFTEARVQHGTCATWHACNMARVQHGTCHAACNMARHRCVGLRAVALSRLRQRDQRMPLSCLDGDACVIHSCVWPCLYVVLGLLRVARCTFGVAACRRDCSARVYHVSTRASAFTRVWRKCRPNRTHCSAVTAMRSRHMVAVPGVAL